MEVMVCLCLPDSSITDLKRLESRPKGIIGRRLRCPIILWCRPSGTGPQKGGQIGQYEQHIGTGGRKSWRSSNSGFCAISNFDLL